MVKGTKHLKLKKKSVKDYFVHPNQLIDEYFNIYDDATLAEVSCLLLYLYHFQIFNSWLFQLNGFKLYAVDAVMKEEEKNRVLQAKLDALNVSNNRLQAERTKRSTFRRVFEFFVDGMAFAFLMAMIFIIYAMYNNGVFM